MKHAFIIFLLNIVFLASGQTLPQNIKQAIAGKKTKDQIKLLDSFAVEYRAKDFKLSSNTSKYALILAKKNDFKFAVVKTYLALCRTYRTHGQHDSALMYVDSAKTFAFDNKVVEQYANVYDYEGLIHMRMGNYENATKCFYKCIEFAEKEKDTLKLHNGFEHLASVNFYRSDYNAAVRFYKRALNFTSAQKDIRQYISTLDNVGLAFSNLRMFDSALFYQKKSVAIIEQLNEPGFLAESYINLGSTLLNLKLYKEAELFIKKAYDINTTIGDEYGEQLSNLYIGKLYLQTNKANEALPYFQKAFAISKKLKIPSQMLEAAKNLMDTYDNLGDYKNSVLYSRATIEIMEQLAEEENIRTINELSAKYEAEKKQQQIQFLIQDKELKENKIQKDRYVKLFIGIVAALLLLLSVIFIYRFREKKKDNNLLASQKNEIEEQKEELQHKNKEITDSINYAQRIQGSVLPSEKLAKTLFPESFIYFKPKDIVSGDFYWIAQNNNFIYYAVADCTGHGVPGAMMSMLGNSLLNQIVLNSKIDSPNIILKELHFHVVKTLNENMQQRASKDGMDIALIRIDLKNKKVVYAGAGRPLYVIKNNRLETYKADKYSIGGVYDTQEVNYILHEIKIDAPTQFYMFTDGVPDQFGGPKGKKFMSKQLQEFIHQTASLPVNEQEQRFKYLFESWKSNVEQTDDVTFISIRLS
ncbi:MAG: tetratricopeptide repeat protein [Bacteroidia bacterium]|nr:tetratricopeptide repeat protein [Bacteroidia bacterium]